MTLTAGDGLNGHSAPVLSLVTGWDHAVVG
jgi:hypothetical protein